MSSFKVLLVFCLVSSTLSATIDDKWPCDKDTAIKAFEKKNIQNMWPTFHNNPYDNQTKESIIEFDNYLKNKTRVCALQYVTTDKSIYNLRDFPSKNDAEDSGYIVTHQGKCGACSNLEDLAVYLKHTDLTTPVRKCGLKVLGFLIRKCLRNLGFTTPCLDIWQYNIGHTRSSCFGLCIKAWIKGTPNVGPDGKLNSCLQCDEDKSGPVFKYYAGRTRRNSGITSAIPRPGQQVYKMNHCYY